MYVSNINQHTFQLRKFSIWVSPVHLGSSIRMDQDSDSILFVKAQKVRDCCEAKIKFGSADDAGRWKIAPHNHTVIIKGSHLRYVCQSLLQPAAHPGQYSAVTVNGSPTEHPHTAGKKVGNNGPCLPMAFLSRIFRVQCL